MFYNIISKGIIFECEKGNFMDIYNQRIAKARNLMNYFINNSQITQKKLDIHPN